MSTNGHEITLKVVETTTPNHRLKGENSNSERVRLDGNIAGRKVTDREFFWWDNELPGFGLRTFPGGAKSWFVQFRQRGKQKRVTLGRPAEMRAEKARALANTGCSKN